MSRFLWILVPLAVVGACAMQEAAPAPHARGTAAGESATFAAGYDDRDCNLHTPLRPGVPGSPGNLIVSSRNPNGDSELSVLMRRFVDDLRDARPRLEKGEPVSALFAVHRTMRCAWPTKPDERNERFDAMAIAYLHLVRAYDAAPGKDTYNGIIAGCIACHSQSCGGPIDFIDGMIWR